MGKNQKKLCDNRKLNDKRPGDFSPGIFTAVSLWNPVTAGSRRFLLQSGQPRLPEAVWQIRGADAAACLYLKPVSYGFFHQATSSNAGGETSRSFHKCSSCSFSGLAGFYFFFIGQQTGLDDNFYDGRGGGLYDSLDVFPYRIPSFRL